MLSDNEYADLIERLRFDLAPKPELVDELPDIRSVVDWTNAYVRISDGTYDKYTAIEGKWVKQNLEEIMIQDFLLELGKGNIPGHKGENKFGLTSNADANVLTDVWDAPAQPVWLAPTGERIHHLVSDSANDTLLGSGARTVKVWGLKTWSSKETFETVNMAGLTPVATAEAYAIIHRMEVITTGSIIFSPNLGNITATAVIDGTVTARIGLGKGQTLMAIYGLPSSQIAYMTSWSASVARDSPQGAEVGVIIRKSTDIVNNPVTYTFKHTGAVKTDGSTSHSHPFAPYKSFVGPCVIKMSFTSGDNDTHGDASFNIILVDN